MLDIRLCMYDSTTELDSIIPECVSIIRMLEPFCVNCGSLYRKRFKFLLSTWIDCTANEGGRTA